MSNKKSFEITNNADVDTTGSVQELILTQNNDLLENTIITENSDSEDNDDSDTLKSKMYRLPHEIVGQQNNENTNDVASTQPYSQGEQSVSGSSPDPESDDDTLANAQAVGMQLLEDVEHPQEIDIARDIDAAERSHRDQ